VRRGLLRAGPFRRSDEKEFVGSAYKAKLYIAEDVLDKRSRNIGVQDYLLHRIIAHEANPLALQLGLICRHQGNSHEENERIEEELIKYLRSLDKMGLISCGQRRCPEANKKVVEEASKDHRLLARKEKGALGSSSTAASGKSGSTKGRRSLAEVYPTGGKNPFG